MKILRIFLIFLIFPSLVNSYALTGSKWPLKSGESIPFYISKELSKNISDSSAFDALMKSFKVWELANCSYAKFKYMGRITPPSEERDTLGLRDNKNMVTWRHRYWPVTRGALAVTSTISMGAGETIESDLTFNGVHYTWATSNHQMRLMDIQGVGTHEVGHLLGLGHVKNKEATMYPSTMPGDLNPRTLAKDDLDGVCNLYPGSGTNPGSGNVEISPDHFKSIGKDCLSYYCETGFCINDTRFPNPYCTNTCTKIACPDQFQCLNTNKGGSACAKKENGNSNTGTGSTNNPGGHGQSCQNGCKNDFICVKASQGNPFCTSKCQSHSECPNNYICTSVKTGGGACIPGNKNQEKNSNSDEASGCSISNQNNNFSFVSIMFLFLCILIIRKTKNNFV